MKGMEADFVIIGTGLAGTAAAHLLSKHGSVVLVSKAPPTDSNSFAAQGGMAAAVGKDDDPGLHATDTVEAGARLCAPKAVASLTETGPKVVTWLNEMGVPFDLNAANEISLGLEGAHSRHRILHAGGDATGRKVMETLTASLQESSNVQRVSNVQVLSLFQNEDGRVTGAVGQVVDAKAQAAFYGRRGVILATGGVGRLFERTTNPSGATADGIALAYQAGASLRNLEFVQFHPTTLDLDGYPSFLISEAVRGAGGRLLDDAGEAVMEDYPQRDLEPRDVVARAIYRKVARGQRVYLDCRKIDKFAEKFPTINERCLSYGINPSADLIPVSPAAHFMMGGVVADLNGITDVPGLYAIGEVASTGVHGANRLASNSLLECLVMAFSLAEYMESQDSHVDVDIHASSHQVVSYQFVPDSAEVLAKVQGVMWKTAGIVRDALSLRQGLKELMDLTDEYPRSAAICTARLILESALSRQESRGAHFRSDFPHRDERMDHVSTVVRRETDGPLLLQTPQKGEMAATR